MKAKNIALILTILIISGCINLNPSETATKSALLKGTSGLMLSFIENAPPKRVFEETPFSTIVKIENKGNYKVGIDDVDNQGVFLIIPESGYADFDDVKNQKEKNEYSNYKKEGKSEFKIMGRELTNPAGDEIFIYTHLKAKPLSSLSSIHSSSVFATVCYPYQTKLNTDVCVDRDVYNLVSGGKACTVKNLAFSGGQGAPLAITKIEVDIEPSDESKVKVNFIINIENLGKGEIVNINNYKEACGEKEGDSGKLFNVAGISGKISTVDLDCGKKEFVLSGKRGVIRCTAEEVDAAVAFVAPLSINLDYGYTETISKGFNIES